jgi:gluconate 2-dehydrogenase alpha chain
MAKKLPATDVVTVGVGWTGSILAAELAAAGLRVVGLERGPARKTSPDFEVPGIHDELKYAVRYALMQDPSQTTITFRNDASQVARPMRRLGSFLPGEGTGGAGVHWNGMTWRYLPYDLEIATRTVARYGKAKIPPGVELEDWGVTYDELEPHFYAFEDVAGTGGESAPAAGALRLAGLPFEAPRARPFPSPPMKVSHQGAVFREAARATGYHPFVVPSSNGTRARVNRYGIATGACVYCGFCERFGCETTAKASPIAHVLPAALATGRFELRTRAHVLRVDLDRSGKRATGVTYLDLDRGEEVIQPAEIVLVTAFPLNAVHLLLISGIGAPYAPATGKGTVGRGYTYQCVSGVTAFFDDRVFNPFMGAGAMGVAIDDLNADNFDHSSVQFVHGAYLATYTTGGWPITNTPVPDGVPAWGGAWKKAVASSYLRSLSITAQGAVLPHRENHLDLDPTYRDAYGQPLLRMTFDWHDNELALARHMNQRAQEIARATGARALKPTGVGSHPEQRDHYGIVAYQTTHNTGGAMMGTDPRTSVVNRYLQSWDVPNVFVIGASAFRHNSSYNPTGTVGALAFWAAQAIRTRYLRASGPLVPT